MIELPPVLIQSSDKENDHLLLSGNKSRTAFGGVNSSAFDVYGAERVIRVTV